MVVAEDHAFHLRVVMAEVVVAPALQLMVAVVAQDHI
jgi:hypothetical protein